MEALVVQQLLNSFIEAEKLKPQMKSRTNPRARRATAQEAQA